MGILCLLIWAFIIAVVLTIVLSWFPLDSDSPFSVVWRVCRQITDPVLTPLRRVLPNLGGLDMSPLIVMIVLQVVARRLC